MTITITPEDVTQPERWPRDVSGHEKGGATAVAVNKAIPEADAAVFLDSFGLPAVKYRYGGNEFVAIVPKLQDFLWDEQDGTIPPGMLPLSFELRVGHPNDKVEKD